LIAQVRYKHKLAFYQYQRKRARWQELFLHIDKLVKKPITYNKEDVGKNVSQVDLAELKATDRVDEDKLALKPIEMKRKWAVFFKALAFLSFIWALVVLATETTLIFDPQYTLVNFFVEQNSQETMAVFVFSVLFLSGITLNCIFTIFNLKISDSLQLREQQTDCVQMAAITGLCSKIVNVICFNYMVICGEVSLDYESQPFHTSFVEFYGSMLKTPFFGSYYNVIAPALILLLGLVFAALGFF
jgi:hypothetical protein